ncbi:MAG: serine hydrolase [Syntrophaceae bacterium]
MSPRICATPIKRLLLIALCFAVACLGNACNGSSSQDGTASSKHASSTQDEARQDDGSTDTDDGSSDTDDDTPVYTGDAWKDVTAAIDAQADDFSDGLTVEIATPQGVVYSHSWNGFSNNAYISIMSASKWVSATVLLRLVDQKVLSLDEKMSRVLKDRDGDYWSGHMGDITLRRLLSMTSGIYGEDLNFLKRSDLTGISLEEAVYRIYDTQHSALSTLLPGRYFFYGSTHFRIAARYAEVKTGKSWAQIYNEQLRSPLGWSSRSVYDNSDTNPDPAYGLKMTGQEYMKFMLLQLRGGLNGTTRLLSESILAEQHTDQFLSTTSILFSPYSLVGKIYHYGLGNWIDSTDTNPGELATQVSSAGVYGWVPWINFESNYAAVIMTQEALGDLDAEKLKKTLAAIIPAALAKNPPVIRSVP